MKQSGNVWYRPYDWYKGRQTEECQKLKRRFFILATFIIGCFSLFVVFSGCSSYIADIFNIDRREIMGLFAGFAGVSLGLCWSEFVGL